MSIIERAYEDFIRWQRDQGLERVLQDGLVPSARYVELKSDRYLNFSSNDYLALSHHPELAFRAKEWTDHYGAGSGASRLVTGNLDVFKVLEDKVAAFKQKEAALVMVSGYQANASVLPALFDKKVLGKEPLVFSDKLNHASMHTGCNAAGVKQIRYSHNDMDHLHELLQRHVFENTPKFILTESVFSMDGDMAPLEDLYELRDRHNAFLIVDEAHSTGILGEKGRGLADKADLVIGTFSKAMGGFGAYVACNKNVKKYLVNRCSGLIYATALPPAVLGAIDASLDLAPMMDDERDYVAKISQKFRSEMKALEFDTGSSQTQIVPVIIGASDKAMEISKQLRTKNIWATPIRPPTVPANAARIRFAFNAAHTEDDLDYLIESMKPGLKAAA